MALLRLNTASDLLLAATSSYHIGDPSALRIWEDTLHMSAIHAATVDKRSAEELVKHSVRGEPPNALFLGSLVHSLQPRITVYSETLPLHLV